MTPALHAESDAIHIEQLRLLARVGVSLAERETPQSITLSLTLWPNQPLTDLDDDISKTIDYALVAAHVRNVVAARCDNLIETLAEKIAEEVLRRFPLERVRIELRKFVFDDAAHVAVVLTRSRQNA
ncbi:MAG: dihydroneopterin aldolase [Verrucomicrobiota bacterium]|nr:dihydroneopterin aldolase [Verrucomicrobiota bacterium]